MEVFTADALAGREGYWRLLLEGTHRTFMNSFSRTTVAFELGPPGRITPTGAPK